MIGRIRRFQLACIAVVLATVVLHNRIADLLVMRGDGLLAAGQPAAARSLYARALWFQPTTTTASERLVFSDFEIGGILRLREAIKISEQGLRQDPDNAALWTDRGLCASRLGDDRAAKLAFLRAGQLTRNHVLMILSARASRRNRVARHHA